MDVSKGVTSGAAERLRRSRLHQASLQRKASLQYKATRQHKNHR